MIEPENNESVYVGWSFDWPTIEELSYFAQIHNLNDHEVEVQMEIVGGKVRITLRGKT